MAGRPFEVEVSVDETESPTTNVQHVYIAHELRRLGVRWVSLAPRSATDQMKSAWLRDSLRLNSCAVSSARPFTLFPNAPPHAFCRPVRVGVKVVSNYR